MAQIYSIVYQPEKTEVEEPYQYNRIRTQQANLITDHGIEGDRKAGKQKSRQVNIMSYEALQTLRDEGYKVEPGEMGEQIIVQGLDVDSLKPFDVIRLGENALLEIRKPRTGCVWFERIQGNSKDQAKDRMGMMCHVRQGGVIREGDEVSRVG